MEGRMRKGASKLSFYSVSQTLALYGKLYLFYSVMQARQAEGKLPALVSIESSMQLFQYILYQTD